MGLAEARDLKSSRLASIMQIRAQLLFLAPFISAAWKEYGILKVIQGALSQGPAIQHCCALLGLALLSQACSICIRDFYTCKQL